MSFLFNKLIAEKIIQFFMKNYLSREFFTKNVLKHFLMKSYLSNVFFGKFPNYWGAFALLFVVVLIGLLNFKSGTILTGWDNLHPEFAPHVNIKRSIFAVWQEYQGLGLLGGMGHASDLVRQIILAFFGAIMPMEIVRYVWMILSLFIGSLGTYLFIKTLLIPYLPKRREAYSFLGGLFYLLNLSTVQTYYAAFEAFTSHYAFAPWMLWAFLSYVRKSSRRNLLILLAVCILGTPSAYIPTLFVAFTIILTIMVSSLLLTAKNKRKTAFNSLKAYAVLGIVNAFWLLPFLFFTLTNASVNLNAKMNQMATSNIFAQNKEFGNIFDVAILKGFWFNNVDPDIDGNFRYMMLPWREHLDNPLVLVALLILFGVVLLGIFNVLIKRRPLHIAVLFIFLFTFTMLSTNTPPFSWFVNLFREIPLFGQAFRFPFTKFSILASFSFSLLFVLGLEYISSIRQSFFRRFSTVTLPILAATLILIATFPVFKGNLFYEKEQLKLPQEYYRTFDYFKKVDQNVRIANLPQHTFWGWNFYNWGYGGSGFLWYGIKQPIMDRAFDVWSKELENYYYELSHALYSKDPVQFENVLNKYHISYLLIDRNVTAPNSPKALFYGETEALIGQIPTIKKVQSFGNISIYEVSLKDKPQNYLYTTPLLPSSNGYSWTDTDTAYKTFGNYQTQEKTHKYIPFTSLFTKKSYAKDYRLEADKDSITLTKKLPGIELATLTLPDVVSEKLIPIEIEIKKDSGGNAVISAHILTPKVMIGNITVSDSTPIYYPLFVVPEANGNYTVSVNGVQNRTFDIEKETKFKSYVFLQNDTFITLQREGVEEVISQKIDQNYINSLPSLKKQTVEVRNIPQGAEMKVILPNGTDDFYSLAFAGKDFNVDTECNIFRTGTSEAKISQSSLYLTAKNDTVCASILAETLPHDVGYIASLHTENIKGSPLHFWMLNTNDGHAVFDTHVESNDEMFIIPPMETHGLSYSFHADSVSIGNNISENVIKTFEVTPLPYSYIANISFDNEFKSRGNPIQFTSTHPNESFYTLTPMNSINEPTTIVLSQAYSTGWKAYISGPNNQNSKLKSALFEAFPFLFGTEIKTHIKVNNWANGWETRESQSLSNKKIAIVYLPQYLEYAGFLGLFGLIICLSLNKFYLKIDNYFKPKALRIKTKVNSLLKN